MSDSVRSLDMSVVIEGRVILIVIIRKRTYLVNLGGMRTK